jgi:hypothetical protein
MSPAARPRQRSERGVVIIWTAFFLLVMLGFVAIGIDVAKLMATRTQLQNAADAAALAGASAMSPADGKILPDTAIVRAQAIAALNKAFSKEPVPIILAAGDISFPDEQSVQVTVRRNAALGGSMITHVAQVVGVKSLDVKATAVARAEPVGEPCDGIVPMGAIQPPTEDFKVGCANTYNLKIGANGGGTPGNFQLLDFPPCDEGPCAGLQGGGAEVRCEVAHGYSCCIKIGDLIQTMPGTKVGPFKSGLDDRWDADTDKREGICYKDYKGNGMRVVLVPTFRDWDPNGKKPVRIDGFAAFFLQLKPSSRGGQSLTGEFLYYSTPGEPGNGPPGSTLFTIHLVK